MSCPNQSETSHTAANEKRPSLEETLKQVQQSQADFASLKAQSDAIASLNRVLDSLVEEDKGPSPA
jgi:ABC-type transporter Mla subunit MlaD